MRNKIITLLSLLLTLVACSRTTLPPEHPSLTATSLKGDPQIAFNVTEELLLVDITSPTGIGSAEIAKPSGQWPAKIVLRFHLSSLEDLKFHYGDTALEVHVSSHGANLVSEAVTKNGTTRPLAPGQLLDAQYWMGVQIVGADGAPATVPVKNGHIDVTVPPDFFRSKETKFTVEWIDFYR